MSINQFSRSLEVDAHKTYIYSWANMYKKP